MVFPLVEWHGEAAVDELPVVQGHRDESACKFTAMERQENSPYPTYR